MPWEKSFDVDDVLDRATDACLCVRSYLSRAWVNNAFLLPNALYRLPLLIPVAFSRSDIEAAS